MSQCILLASFPESIFSCSHVGGEAGNESRLCLVLMVTILRMIAMALLVNNRSSSFPVSISIIACVLDAPYTESVCTGLIITVRVLKNRAIEQVFVSFTYYVLSL